MYGYHRPEIGRHRKYLCPLALVALGTALAGCAGPLERQAHAGLSRAAMELDLRPAAAEIPAFAGTLDGYLAFALKHDPQTRASFERWRAATLQISRSRRLPEPMLSYGYFVRSVETRVGPQRHRIGLSQTFPWPGKLSARADAASATARAARSMFDAEVLAVRKRIASAYWKLWLIHEEHRRMTEHDAVLEALAGAVRGRVKTGAASLADLNQVELNIARHHDHRGKHEQAARKASARLLQALGLAADGRTLLAIDQPGFGLPAMSESEMRRIARDHPRIERHGHLASSRDHMARAERADRLPRFRLGLDYIVTEDAAMPGVQGSGKDPLIVSAGLSLPLWRGSYSDAERAARAASAAHRAEHEAALRAAEAELEQALANVRDSARRIELYDKTLLPQAEATFRAVLGGYQTGRSEVASVVLAQRDLLDLQVEQARARAQRARAWADLEFVVGREIAVAKEPAVAKKENQERKR